MIKIFPNKSRTPFLLQNREGKKQQINLFAAQKKETIQNGRLSRTGLKSNQIFEDLEKLASINRVLSLTEQVTKHHGDQKEVSQAKKKKGLRL
jgi:hypothetical protein